MRILSRNHRAGFTLIELIMVLALSGICLVFGVIMVVSLTENYVASREAVEEGQKMQVAMSRLVKELTFADNQSVVVTNARTIEWLCQHPDSLGESKSLSWNGIPGSQLNLNGKILFNKVEDFSVSSTAIAITLTLTPVRANSISLTAVVHPR